MREWKALNVRGCGSGSKSKICESEFNVQCLWGGLWLQPEAIPYIKLTTELYPGILSLTHTVRQQIWLTCCCWFVPPYVSMFSPDVCHQNCLRRSEGELNFIRQSRVFKQWKRTKRSIQPHGYTTFHTFQKGRQKNGARTERTWYLIWKAADRCLWKVGHSECCCSDAVVACVADETKPRYSPSAK